MVSCVLSSAGAILIEFLGPTGIKWLSIVAGFVGGLVVAFVALDPVLNALGRLEVPRRLGEPIFFIVAAVLPGALTVAIAMAMASLLR
jgi:hypothetical protein